MKKNYYNLIVLLLFSFTNIFAGQQFNSKVKKNPAQNASQKNVSLSLNKSLKNIGNNFSVFALRNNVSLKKNNSVLNSASVNLMQKMSALQLPSSPSSINSKIKKIYWNKSSGTPRFIEMSRSSLKKGVGAVTVAEREVIAKDFLSENKTLLKISDPQNEFKLINSVQDENGSRHFKFAQTFKGLEVWGKELIVHMDAAGNVNSINGVFESTPALENVNGVLNSEGAINQALYEIRKTREIKELSSSLNKIMDYNGPSAKKIIWFDKNHKAHLAWHVEVRSGLTENWYYFIDANTTEVLNYYNNVCFDGPQTATANDLNGKARQIGTYQVGSNYFMMDVTKSMFNAGKSTIPSDPIGAIAALDLRNNDFNASSTIYYVSSSNNQWTDPTAVSANYNAAQTYDYYLNVHKRNSIDNKGMTIYSIVHVTDDGNPMENAYWNGKVMCYGDGANYFKPLAGAIDVAAHEMTHGVTEYTAGLEYQNQSGALNESFSDVFGVLVDSLNWQMGEEIIKNLNSFPSGALRDVSDPHNGGTSDNNYWQPAKMSEFVQLQNTEDQDYGGVHVNSGIPNFAFYNVATSIGRFKAGKIWYKALTQYLTKNSEFLDARIATEKAAVDIYGDGSAELQAVKNGWDAVEVFEGTSTPDTPTYELSGSEYVLVTNTDSNDNHSLYMCNPDPNNFGASALTTSSVSNRPAVTDVSGVILFIDGDHNLRALNANKDNPQEQALSSDNYWWSVAAGPGLNSIALTSIYQDTTIYYYDFVNDISKEFKIVTQTYDGIDVKTALYADALAFDPSGKYILFDCYNEFTKADGSKINYWTMNMLEISTGRIVNVFPPQSEGINIGNPAFSKTSQDRFTFDYEDSGTNQIYVMAADFNTGKVGTVAGPLTTLGYPTYSADDKKIAYHSISSQGGVDHDAIFQMPLQDNFVDGTNNPINYLIDAKYPFWFVVGTRTDVKEETEIPSGYALMQNYPNPFNPTTTISYQIPQAGFVTLKIYDVLGREVETLVNGFQNAGSYKFTFGSNSNMLSSGIYFYKLNSGNFTLSRKMILMK